MEQPVNVKYRWTVTELESAYRCHNRQSSRISLLWLVHFLSGLFIVVGVYHIRTGNEPANGIFMITIGLAWSTFMIFGRRWFARRHFTRRPDRDQEIEWQIFPDRLVVHSGLGQSEFKWEALAKAVRTPNGFLLYPNDRIFHWLPRHGFDDPDDFDRLSELARVKLQKFKSLT